MTDPQVMKGSKISFQRDGKTFVGIVAEVHGRSVGREGVDRGWVTVEVDGQAMSVAEGDFVEVDDT